MTNQTATAALTVDELRADFEHSKRMHLTRPRFSTEEIGSLFAEIDRLRATRMQMLDHLKSIKTDPATLAQLRAAAGY